MKPDLAKIKTTPESGAGRTEAEVEQSPEGQAWIAYRQSLGEEYLGTLINPFTSEAMDALNRTANTLVRRRSMLVLDHVLGVAMVFEQPNQFPKAARHFDNSGKS